MALLGLVFEQKLLGSLADSRQIVGQDHDRANVEEEGAAPLHAGKPECAITAVALSLQCCMAACPCHPCQTTQMSLHAGCWM